MSGTGTWGSRYRYPGARPFEQGETGVFFGREIDIQQLAERLQLEELLVLYAKSGLGKSSLLNAGLLPRLAEEQQLEAFPIRLQAFQEGSTQNILPLDRARAALAIESSLLDRLHASPEKDLWYLLKARQLQAAENWGAILVFDQFEELFTYPKAAIASFAQQLSDLLYTTIPDVYRKGMERNMQGDAGGLSDEELQKLHQPLRLRVIMAIRSDRYSLLDRLKPYLPSILDNTYELQALSRRQAEDAILNPAYSDADFISPIFDFEDAAVDHLIQFLSQDVGQRIESFQLQILCEHIERRLVITQGKSLICRDDLKEPQLILEDYYHSKIADIVDPGEQLAARRLIEEGLIFEEEERRLSLYEGQIERSYGVEKTLLDQLVATHLLRAEPSLRGGYTYELSHDTLVGPVLKAKGQRLHQEEIRRQAAAEHQRMAELAVERRKRRRATILAGFMAGLAIMAVVASVFAFVQYQNAESAKTEAIERQAEAEENLRQRIRLEVNGLLQDASILTQAGQYTLARQKLEEALQLDSTNVQLREQLRALENN